jgi:hypothetical protein
MKIHSRRQRGRGMTIFLGILAVLLALPILWTWLMLSWSYSKGDRAGVLLKFSKQGWLCKTYEGELALYVVGGVAPQIWHFSTRDEALAKALTTNVGRQVQVQYSEHRLLPTDCFAETPYFAESFVEVPKTQ